MSTCKTCVHFVIDLKKSYCNQRGTKKTPQTRTCKKYQKKVLSFLAYWNILCTELNTDTDTWITYTENTTSHNKCEKCPSYVPYHIEKEPNITHYCLRRGDITKVGKCSSS